MPRDRPRRDRSSTAQARSRNEERDRDTRDRDTDEQRQRRRDRDRSHDRERRRRRGHRATDSTGELLPRPERSYRGTHHSESPSPTKRERRSRQPESARGSEGSRSLQAGSLAQLDKLNAKSGWRSYDDEYVREVQDKERELEEERMRAQRREAKRIRAAEREKRRRYEEEMGLEADVPSVPLEVDQPSVEYLTEREYRRRREYTPSEKEERRRLRNEASETPNDRKKKSRVVSGPLLEKGGDDEWRYQTANKRGGAGSEDYDDAEWRKKRRKRIYIIVAVVLIVLAIVIPVAVIESRKSSSNDIPATATDSSKPANTNLDGMSESDIPTWAQGGLLDPFTWYDTADFNVTFTNDTVGGLSVMGLNSTWDDTTRANDNVPALDETWEYGTMQIRGMNVGGWLNMEPFITPSYFEAYSTRDGVVDEWTLVTTMGATKAKSTLEKHYSSWVTEQTFADIQAAGFDHVRIPFAYWAVTVYDDDPYVAKVSWRYLLRGIEWARKYGLRVNLDLHGLPGSQNGWNHSGRQGVIGWLNGTDGDLNAQRSLDIHGQLSTFFSQPRYKNIIALYGLVNEPRMVELNTQDVLDWYNEAIPIVRNNNYTGIIVFGDGFMGLDNWQGKLQNYTDLLLDVHQYVIFNVDQLSLDHSEKLNFACAGWTKQSTRSMDTSTGFGPTICGEWSQADTDCAQYVNDIGIGTRWEGTYNTGNTSTEVLTPTCPTDNDPVCSCTNANADPSTYSDAYKKWLLDFAEAQMYSFEQGWGWFYWTWETESATQWSWKLGMAAGILPTVNTNRSFTCNDSIPDFASMGLPEEY